MEESTVLQQKQLLFLSSTLNDLRCREVLSDVFLICDEQRFPANRAVLAANSSFFAEMFGNFSSDVMKKESIPLHKISPDIMKILLEFIYTGVIIDIDETDVNSLLALCSAACHLQIDLLAEHCCQLVELLSPPQAIMFEFQNCVTNLTNSDLKAQLMGYLGQTYYKLHETPDFLELPLESIIDIMSNEDRIDNCADETLGAIIKWINHDTANRSTHTSCLLQHIEKDDLSDGILVELQHMQTSQNISSPEIMMFVLNVVMSRYQRQKSGMTSLRSSCNSLDQCSDTILKPKPCMAISVEKKANGSSLSKEQSISQDAEDDASISKQQVKAINGSNSLVVATTKVECRDKQLPSQLVLKPPETSAKHLIVTTRNKNPVVELNMAKGSNSYNNPEKQDENSPLIAGHQNRNRQTETAHRRISRAVVSESLLDETEKRKEIPAKLQQAGADLKMFTSSTKRVDTTLVQSNMEKAGSNRIHQSSTDGPTLYNSKQKKAHDKNDALLVKHQNSNHHAVSISHPVTNNTVINEGEMCKESSAKPQHAVADLSLLSLGKKKPEKIPIQPSTEQTLGNGSTKLNASIHSVSGNSKNADDIFSNLAAAIQKHENTRNSEKYRSRSQTRNSDPRAKSSYHSLDRTQANNVLDSHKRNCSFGKTNNRGRHPSHNKNCSRDRSCSSERQCSRQNPGNVHKINTYQPVHRQNVAVMEDNQCNGHEPMPPNSTSLIRDLAVSNQPRPSKGRIAVPIESKQECINQESINQKCINQVLYFVLGKDNQQWLMQTFDPNSNGLSEQLPIQEELYQRCSVVSSGHVVYLIGGKAESWEVMATVWMYDSRTNKWQKMTDMKTARWGAGIARVQNIIYVVGGVSEDNTRLSQVERYDTELDTWTSIAPLNSCREDPSVSAIHNLLFAVGGYIVFPDQLQVHDYESDPTATAELYNPATNQWTEIKTPMDVGREIREKTFWTISLGDRIFAIRRHGASLNLPAENPVLWEFSLKHASWDKHRIPETELTDIVGVCSLADDQLCLVTKQGSVYSISSHLPGVIVPKRLYQGNTVNLLYAVSATH